MHVSIMHDHTLFVVKKKEVSYVVVCRKALVQIYSKYLRWCKPDRWKKTDQVYRDPFKVCTFLKLHQRGKDTDSTSISMTCDRQFKPLTFLRSPFSAVASQMDSAHTGWV